MLTQGSMTAAQIREYEDRSDKVMGISSILEHARYGIENGELERTIKHLTQASKAISALLAEIKAGTAGKKT